MVRNSTRSSMRYMAAFFFIICFSASAFADGSVTIKWGKDANVEQSDANQKNKNNGPPAHAPAHGYRAKYQYRYYPDRSVYYDTSRKIYFYLQGSNWEFGASLPASFRAGLGDFVNLEMDTGKPYLYHGQHVKKYPPGQVKQNKQKKWSKKSHKK